MFARRTNRVPMAFSKRNGKDEIENTGLGFHAYLFVNLYSPYEHN
jgi:hypothetical protein